MTRPPAHARRSPSRCPLASSTAKALLGIALAIALVLSPWEPLLPKATPQLGTPPAHAQELDDDGGGGDQNPPPDNNGPENGPPGGEVGPPAQNNDGETPEETPTQAPGDECAQPPPPGDEDRGTGADGGPAGVVCGTPSPCPSDLDDTRPGWAPDPSDPSRCVLTMPACPRSPLQEAGQPINYMEPSPEYAEFCQHPVLESQNQFLFGKCKLGFAVPQERNFTYKVEPYNHAGTNDTRCTAILPSRCPSGMHRLAPSAEKSSCRQYERRHWTCTPETARRLNQFNTCYVGRPPPAGDGSHPACSRGAPQFAISDCSAYVGRDYMQAPGDFLCGRYDTGDAPNSPEMQDVADNAHWCAYGPSWLELRCHGTTRTSACQVQDRQSVRCIKRASSGGGCIAVAKTIRCQALRASWRDGSGTHLAEDIQREGCVPCVILPFEPVRQPSGNRALDADACPPEFSRDPNAHPDGDLRRALNMRTSVVRRVLQYNECAEVLNGALLRDHPLCQAEVANQGAFCDNPSVIALEWATALGSGALVNSPVIVNLAGSAIENTAYEHFTVAGGRLQKSSIQAMKYSDTPQTLVSQWPSTRNLHKSQPRGNHEDYVARTMQEAGGACFAQTLPLPRLMVEELWPDTDHDEIVRLFGEVAVRQWDNLTDQQKKASTEARGFVYVEDSASDAAKDAARGTRMRLLREEEHCNVARDSGQWWCRWVPQRAGFYRLTGELVWNLKRWVGHRKWISPADWNRANEWLMTNVLTPDTKCETHGHSERVKDPDCIWEDLQKWGVMRPEDAGFQPGFQGLLDLPNGSDNTEDREAQEALYLDRSPDIHRCPSQDVRVLCQTYGTNFYYAYETTAPVGIIVQEARVVTRAAGTP